MRWECIVKQMEFESLEMKVRNLYEGSYLANIGIIDGYCGSGLFIAENEDTCRPEYNNSVSKSPTFRQMCRSACFKDMLEIKEKGERVRRLYPRSYIENEKIIRDFCNTATSIIKKCPDEEIILNQGILGEQMRKFCPPECLLDRARLTEDEETLRRMSMVIGGSSAQSARNLLRNKEIIRRTCSTTDSLVEKCGDRSGEYKALKSFDIYRTFCVDKCLLDRLEFDVMADDLIRGGWRALMGNQLLARKEQVEAMCKAGEALWQKADQAQKTGKKEECPIRHKNVVYHPVYKELCPAACSIGKAQYDVDSDRIENILASTIDGEKLANRLGGYKGTIKDMCTNAEELMDKCTDKYPNLSHSTAYDTICGNPCFTDKIMMKKFEGDIQGAIVGNPSFSQLQAKKDIFINFCKHGKNLIDGPSGEECRKRYPNTKHDPFYKEYCTPTPECFLDKLEFLKYNKELRDFLSTAYDLLDVKGSAERILRKKNDINRYCAAGKNLAANCDQKRFIEDSNKNVTFNEWCTTPCKLMSMELALINEEMEQEEKARANNSFRINPDEYRKTMAERSRKYFEYKKVCAGTRHSFKDRRASVNPIFYLDRCPNDDNYLGQPNYGECKR